MKLKLLREKSVKDLKTYQNEIAAKFRESRFKIASNQIKNVRTLRDDRQTIARIKTLLREEELKSK